MAHKHLVTRLTAYLVHSTNVRRTIFAVQMGSAVLALYQVTKTAPIIFLFSDYSYANSKIFWNSTFQLTKLSLRYHRFYEFYCKVVWDQ